MKKLSRQALAMSSLTMLFSGLRENAILTNFETNILAGNLVSKIQKGMGRYKGDTTGMDILTTGEILCKNWMCVVEVEVRGHPCGTYLPTKYYICAPFCWGSVSEVVELDWERGKLGLL